MSVRVLGLVLVSLAAAAPLVSDDARLEHARQVNLAYAAAMPSFVADETAKRYTGDSKSTKWKPLDTVESEITFVGTQAVRRQIRRNGKAWEQPFDALPGYKWYGGFGTEIKPLFDRTCPTTIDYAGPAQVRGKALLQYRFSSPADGCFAFFFFENQRSNPARSGHVFVSDPGGEIIQMDEEAAGFPADFGFRQRNEEVSWDYVKIGDDSHLLPVAAKFTIAYSSGARVRIDVEYKNHRHFEASSNIAFPK